MSGVYRLRPFLRRTPWGGSFLASLENIPECPGELPVGELLDASGLPSMPSEVYHADGRRLGHLREVFRAAPEHFLGPEFPRTSEFPILVKRVDSREPMSIQVHPDDHQAFEISGADSGKDEAWLVLHAEPGAEILLGFIPGVTPADVKDALYRGTLQNILRRIPVQANDVYCVPTGCVHSIGAGVVIFEPQQPADLTYRLYDWNRLVNGRARDLHVDSALRVLNCDLRPERMQPLTLRREPGIVMERVLELSSLRTDRWRLKTRTTLSVDRVHVVHVLRGAAELRAENGDLLHLASHESGLLPWSSRVVTVTPLNEVEILAVTPRN